MTRGIDIERKVAQRYRKRGYVVASLRHSPGAGDLLCAREDGYGTDPGGFELLYIEVKGNAGSPYKNFSREEREEVHRIAYRAGADPILAHWPPRGKLQLIPEKEWPGLLSGAELAKVVAALNPDDDA